MTNSTTCKGWLNVKCGMTIAARGGNVKGGMTLDGCKGDKICNNPIGRKRETNDSSCCKRLLLFNSLLASSFAHLDKLGCSVTRRLHFRQFVMLLLPDVLTVHGTSVKQQRNESLAREHSHASRACIKKGTNELQTETDMDIEKKATEKKRLQGKTTDPHARCIH